MIYSMQVARMVKAIFGVFFFELVEHRNYFESYFIVLFNAFEHCLLYQLNLVWFFFFGLSMHFYRCIFWEVIFCVWFIRTSGWHMIWIMNNFSKVSIISIQRRRKKIYTLKNTTSSISKHDNVILFSNMQFDKLQ